MFPGGGQQRLPRLSAACENNISPMGYGKKKQVRPVPYDAQGVLACAEKAAFKLVKAAVAKDSALVKKASKDVNLKPLFKSGFKF